MHIYICVCGLQDAGTRKNSAAKYIYIYVCMYACMHACMHVCMYMYSIHIVSDFYLLVDKSQ